MGTDMYCYAERKREDGTWEVAHVLPPYIVEGVRRFPLDDAEPFPHRN